MSGLVRWTGRLDGLGAGERQALLCRAQEGGGRRLRQETADILDAVRARGDEALRALALTHDGVALQSLEVPARECQAALGRLASPLRRALERAARNLTRVHAAQRPQAYLIEVEPGVQVERRPDPLERVGVYAPGGRAAYPSSVLMGAVPARVAGVAEVVLCSPPGPDGLPAPVVLAAAALSGVDRVFALGGAGAIAALAYGTASVPRVCRIVGPGNAWVAEAKRQVQGTVAIDSPAGPSELLAVVDGGADVAAVARELLAQAEHDPEAAVVALVLKAFTANRLVEALEEGAERAVRREIVSAALRARGAVLVVDSLEASLDFVVDWAPEHLLLAVGDADSVAARVRHAGTIFIGETTSGAFADYCTGANHVLPTGGLARSYSGLSTLDYVRWTTVQRVTRAGAAALAEDVALLAGCEGLFAHAAAAQAWEAP
ncbi:MAG: histidinol dehydrogenase [Myxococcaceae bacterium]